MKLYQCYTKLNVLNITVTINSVRIKCAGRAGLRQHAGVRCAGCAGLEQHGAAWCPGVVGGRSFAGKIHNQKRSHSEYKMQLKYVV